jgi:predicted phosphate transport protein (TIGR00153 family)
MSRQNRELQEKIGRYLEVAGHTFDCLQTGMRHYVKHGLDAHFETLVKEIHAHENDADNLRREIGVDLFAKSMLPDSREDLMLLLERVDLMPNQAEDVLRQIQLQNLRLPTFMHEPLLEMTAIAKQAFELVREGIQDVLAQKGKITEITRRIDDAEEISDQIEQQLVAKIFRSADLPPAERILARDIVNTAGLICDYAQDVGIFLTIFTVKRQV